MQYEDTVAEMANTIKDYIINNEEIVARNKKVEEIIEYILENYIQ